MPPELWPSVHSWEEFLREHWAKLVEGETVSAARWAILPPPEDALPFKHLWLAEPRGQLDDWALSLEDGSRIHIHVHPYTYEVHRDAIDPSQSPLAALHHWVEEAPTGRAAVKAGGVALVLAAIRRALLP